MGSKYLSCCTEGLHHVLCLASRLVESVMACYHHLLRASNSATGVSSAASQVRGLEFPRAEAKYRQKKPAKTLASNPDHYLELEGKLLLVQAEALMMRSNTLPSLFHPVVPA